LDRDLVLEKNVIQSINNLPDSDEFDIVVELEPELEPKKSVLYLNVDGSISSEVSDGDKDLKLLRVILFRIMMVCCEIKVSM
jgi:hypothetical protein